MGQVDQPGKVMPTIPNTLFSHGDPGSCGPMGRSASPVHSPNAMFRGGDAGNGFMPLTKSASPVHGSNEAFKFNVANAQMPQPESAMQPGQGDVPINPFRSGNGVTGPALGISETAVKVPRGK